MTTDFCLDALEAAIRDYGPPGILNTDQGSQFTGITFVGVVQQSGIQLPGNNMPRWPPSPAERMVAVSHENGLEAAISPPFWFGPKDFQLIQSLQVETEASTRSIRLKGQVVLAS